jgi:hypothetical protein
MLVTMSMRNPESYILPLNTLHLFVCQVREGVTSESVGQRHRNASRNRHREAVSNLISE